jgi:hypothetical protein
MPVFAGLRGTGAALPQGNAIPHSAGARAPARANGADIRMLFAERFW